jgi:hypothetical protein
MMTISSLHDAANKIDAKATKLEARVTGDPLRDDQAKQVAGQLRDRASQIRSWAFRAERSTVTPDMESGTAEFLRYAGCS